MELWITNDTLAGVEDSVTVRLGTFAGEIVWEENLRVQIAEGGSQPIRRWKEDRVGGGPNHHLSVRSAKGLFPPNRHFFAAVKDLRRKPVRPEVNIAPNGGQELRVHLQAPQYAYFVHLSVPDEATRFSDNYFDLEPR